MGRLSKAMRKRGYNKYPWDWNYIATELKQKHGWKCEWCGAQHSPNDGFTLTIHHLDRDKANCAEWNLACLCQRCHLAIQNRVDFNQIYMFDYSDWMKPHVEGMLAAMERGEYKPRF